LEKMVVEAFRSGARGPAWDWTLCARPWGFSLSDIGMKVNLWQGEMDNMVPPSMGRYQANTIPNCRAKFYSSEGHIFLVVNHYEEILSAMVC